MDAFTIAPRCNRKRAATSASPPLLPDPATTLTRLPWMPSMNAPTNRATCQPATSISCNGSMPKVEAASASARRSAAEETEPTRSQGTAAQLT